MKEHRSIYIALRDLYAALCEKGIMADDLIIQVPTSAQHHYLHELIKGELGICNTEWQPIFKLFGLTFKVKKEEASVPPDLGGTHTVFTSNVSTEEPKVTRTLDEAKEAVALFSELSRFNDLMRAISVKDKSPLQKVTFYSCTPFFSGPTDYVPLHRVDAITKAIREDVWAQRGVIVGKLRKLGYDVPPFKQED